jgi:hypothetical protein
MRKSIQQYISKRQFIGSNVWTFVRTYKTTLPATSSWFQKISSPERIEI